MLVCNYWSYKDDVHTLKGRTGEMRRQSRAYEDAACGASLRSGPAKTPGLLGNRSKVTYSSSATTKTVSRSASPGSWATFPSSTTTKTLSCLASPAKCARTRHPAHLLPALSRISGGGPAKTGRPETNDPAYAKPRWIHGRPSKTRHPAKTPGQLLPSLVEPELSQTDGPPTRGAPQSAPGPRCS